MATYTVKKGETWLDIAKKHNTTPQQLLTLNKSNTNIYAGVAIKVPTITYWEPLTAIGPDVNLLKGKGTGGGGAPPNIPYFDPIQPPPPSPKPAPPGSKPKQPSKTPKPQVPIPPRFQPPPGTPYSPPGSQPGGGTKPPGSKQPTPPPTPTPIVPPRQPGGNIPTGYRPPIPGIPPDQPGYGDITDITKPKPNIPPGVGGLPPDMRPPSPFGGRPPDMRPTQPAAITPIRDYFSTSLVRPRNEGSVFTNIYNGLYGLLNRTLTTAYQSFAGTQWRNPYNMYDPDNPAYIRPDLREENQIRSPTLDPSNPAYLRPDIRQENQVYQGRGDRLRTPYFGPSQNIIDRFGQQAIDAFNPASQAYSYLAKGGYTSSIVDYLLDNDIWPLWLSVDDQQLKGWSDEVMFQLGYEWNGYSWTRTWDPDAAAAPPAAATGGGTGGTGTGGGYTGRRTSGTRSPQPEEPEPWRAAYKIYDQYPNQYAGSLARSPQAARGYEYMAPQRQAGRTPTGRRYNPAAMGLVTWRI